MDRILHSLSRTNQKKACACTPRASFYVLEVLEGALPLPTTISCCVWQAREPAAAAAEFCYTLASGDSSIGLTKAAKPLSLRSFSPCTV